MCMPKDMVPEMCGFKANRNDSSKHMQVEQNECKNREMKESTLNVGGRNLYFNVSHNEAHRVSDQRDSECLS